MTNNINIEGHLRIAEFYRSRVAAILELYSKVIVKSHQRLFQHSLHI